ncbi:ATP-binding protein [Flammeovirga pectinis]|uniref:ATP-binding protein n=1 Tax=Flammeovirga pectinis TaxID=2494373 RepID=A0A3S9NYB8_9BACT|nr:AAA family ATPase [Flammeovirga pectinis]AZQ60865.1 ATP-binding protein [Flammeovirga pectinis]
MKRLILLRGLPGAGKSTLAASLGGSIEADDFMVDKNGNYFFDPKKLPFAHKQCEEMTAYCMGREQELIIVSNTFTTEKEMRGYFLLAEKHNYEVSTVIVENRHNSSSIHDVPNFRIQKMKDRFDIKL